MVERVDDLLLVLDWRRLAWPADWAAIFDREARLTVEVGFGNGGFLAALAAQNPDQNFVGLEVSLRSLERAASRLRRQQATNVRLVRMEGSLGMRVLFEPESLQAVYVNFPDPWPKKGHQKRRLVDEEFVERTAERLEWNGTLTIATDHGGYAEEIAAALAQELSLRTTFDDRPWTNRLRGRQPTKYELKARREGREVFYFVWRKAHRSPIEHLPPYAAPEEEGMPNVVLEGQVRLSEVMEAFRPLEQIEGEDVVKIEEAYIRRDRAELLLESLAVEGSLSQGFFVTVLTHDDGLLVKLARAASPRRTEGVKHAVGMVARWIAEEFPDVEISSWNA